jgi:hypothetical protein
MAKGKTQSGAFDLANDGTTVQPEAPEVKPTASARGVRVKSGEPALRGKTVMFREDLRRPLKMVAFDEGCSESDVINRLLEQYLKEKKYL